ncbi:hypothetical protein [Mycobacterium sp.]|uniref:hypothetical protein n=1 Tax=Mycobacterium sp. TaxID=1785 RepID=UPI0033423A0F
MPDAITYADITSIGRCTDRIEFSGAVGQMSSTLAPLGIAWPAGIRSTCQLQGRIVVALFTFSAPVRDPHWKQKVETGSSALNTSKAALRRRPVGATELQVKVVVDRLVLPAADVQVDRLIATGRCWACVRQ